MEKNIFIIRENDLSYGRGYVYSLQYHLVWCTKYRKKVLQNGLDEECKKMLYEIADEYKFQIVAMEVMPDHIHLLVDLISKDRKKKKQESKEVFDEGSIQLWCGNKKTEYTDSPYAAYLSPGSRIFDPCM